jgi:carbonic anhydrase/acetyltransferase-like protein (isoleucine patch superfamily)
MPLFEFDGKAPQVHPTAFVAPTATLVGEVTVEEVLAAGSPAVVKRPIAGTPAEFWVQTNPSAYADLAQRHRQLVRQVAEAE